MKKVALITVYFSTILTFAQPKFNDVYFEAISTIKESTEFRTYCADQNTNNKIRVANFNYEICESLHFFNEHVNDSLVNYCNNLKFKNWKSFKNKLLAKQSDRGERKMRLWLSNVYNNYFIAEVNYRKSNEYLQYLFKVNSGHVQTVKIIKVYLD